MFAKTRLASSIAVALGVAAAGTAQARDSVFFPYVVFSDSVATVVSIINTADMNWNNQGNNFALPGHMHYRLYYKTGANADNPTALCEEYDEYLPTSQNDLQTIDLAAHYGNDTQGVMFNDPSIQNNWQGSNRDYALGRYIAPARGYLFVDTVDERDAETQPFAEDDVSSLSGEAFIFDFGAGATWGYRAFANGTSDPADVNRPVTYKDYTWAASQNNVPVPFMPLNEITTAFFVTPVSFVQAPDFQNNYRGRIEFVTTVRGDVYDRDENLISGTVKRDVVCVGRINVTQLLTDGVQNRIVDGGWGRLRNYRLSSAGAPVAFNRAGYVAAIRDMGAAFDLNNLPIESLGGGLSAVADNNETLANPAVRGNIVIKLEYNSEDGTFNGEPTEGVSNNAYVIPHATF